MQCITIAQTPHAPTRDLPPSTTVPAELPPAKEIKLHPSASGEENASLFFVGTATTIMFVRTLHSPNPTSCTPVTMSISGPACPASAGLNLGWICMNCRGSTWCSSPTIMGMYLLRFALPTQPSAATDQDSDHFDQKVEASLRRDLPIITTPHAQAHLTAKGADSFTSVAALDPFEHVLVDIEGVQANKRGRHPRLRVTGMPGKHVPPNPIVEKLNALANAVGSSVSSMS
ncbi:hypothetical protein N7510_009346 [Penicillium lagena]|uniref:uncharacterized protein n=1 Tax=Penicillium lagena TaxID=94218 RepID=UPI002541C930|nr:uncharacterized protein N7510_009346 [Penicillium lagena]KAJ5606565.1 hypothetical protein N7510_009346 [Penicillium lagena]